MKNSIVKMGGRTSWLATFALGVLAGCGGGDSEKSSAPATGGNLAPTIQGSPTGTAVAGQAYSFQPTASDADGDTLTFTVSNLPAWASFNQSSGRVSGTPDAADIATYSNIRVTVSDGEATASTNAFSITVTDVVAGSVTLSWTPPTQNSDGSALTNLAGYQVHYGRSQNQLDQMISLSNGSLNTYVVENLTAGTWFFMVVAVSGSGATSDESNVASRTVT